MTREQKIYYSGLRRFRKKMYELYPAESESVEEHLRHEDTIRKLARANTDLIVIKAKLEALKEERGDGS